jgi:MFS family permease
MILVGAFAISRVRPDPREIALNLEQYYPGYRPEPRDPAQPHGKMNIPTYFSSPTRRTASIANFAATGNMSIVMTVTSLVLHSHGHSLASIAIAQATHSSGMWGLSLFMGKLADRLGRRPVTLAGLLVATLGSLFVAFTSTFWLVALGAFLVGLGWSAVNVSSTVSIADTTQPYERGQAVGLNDSFASAATFMLPIVAGTIAQVYGLPWTGVLAIALMTLPILLVATSQESGPRRKTRPGAATPAEAKR